MVLTKDIIKKVAKLANIAVTDEEETLYATQLSQILDYVEQLNQIDTEDVAPTFNVTGLKNVFRDDKVNRSLSQDAALQNAVCKNGFFVTKGVFNEE